MPRYFVAIPPPDDVRDQLVRAQPAASAGLRIVSRDDLHLTLHFLGEVAEARTEALHRALGQVRAEPFKVSISGSGWFSQPSGAVFYYARIEPSPSLIELHRAVGMELRAAIGFEIELRPYLPHITLARCEMALPLAEIEQLARTLSHIRFESMPVERFSLYSSEWVNGDPVYRELRTYDLRGPNPA